MIFCTQVRRATEKSRLAPVVVQADEFRAKFANAMQSPCIELQMRVRIQTDTDQDGTPDSDEEWSYWEVDKILFGTAQKRSQLDTLLRNGGLKASHMRQFMKNRVREHNDKMWVSTGGNPGEGVESYIDIDTDMD